MLHIQNRIITVALLSLPALASSFTIAKSETPTAAGASIETLKAAYLRCERTALSGRLATGDIMLCSVVYEMLKERAFEGDFKQLKSWADAQLRQGATTGQAATAEANAEF